MRVNIPEDFVIGCWDGGKFGAYKHLCDLIVMLVLNGVGDDRFVGIFL